MWQTPTPALFAHFNTIEELQKMIGSASLPRGSNLSVCNASPVEPATLQYLTATIERFEKALDGLRCRVAPVLRPMPPGACSPPSQPPPFSDIRMRIYGLDNLVSRLVETTDQIDL